MANRTVIVDNNTWNNTHIATVGTAMSSPEKAAWEIFNSLDVKYVLVVFGGLLLFPYQHLIKFLDVNFILIYEFTYQVLLATPVMILINSYGWSVSEVVYFLILKNLIT